MCIRDSHDAEEIDASVDSSPPVTDEATNPYAAPKNVGMKDLPSDEPSFYVATAWAPVVISAVLFGLVHLGQGPAPIPIFVFGLGLGMIYRQTGRILPCIVAHFMLNGFSMTVYTVEQLYFPSDAVETAPALEPAVSLLTLWM